MPQFLNFRDGFVRFVVERPALVLCLAAAVSLAAGSRLVGTGTGALALEVDPSIRALLPRDGEELARFETIRERFASDDLLLVAWMGDEVFTPAGLGRFKRLSKAIERLPGIEHVESLATALRTQVLEDYTVVDPYLIDVPGTLREAEDIRDAARSNPLYSGYLIAGDGSGTLIAVRFDRLLPARERIALVARIAEASAEHAEGIEQFLSGPLYARLEISRLLLRDLYLVMPLAVIATLFVVGLAYRHARGVCLPFAANCVALCVTLALFIHLGETLNYVTVILPPTIYVVGFAYAIHVVSDFDRHLAEGLSRPAAARAALEDVLLPLLLTAFTTATGFAALTVSAIDSIAIFGAFAALGTLTACAAALTVVPAALVLFPASTRPAGRVLNMRTVDSLTAAASRHGGAMLVCGVAVAAMSCAGAARIQVGTDYLENFSAQSELRRDFERLNAAFAGAVPLQIVIESKQENAFHDPGMLREVRELQAWLEKQAEVGGAYSLVDYVAELEQALAPELVDGDRLPQSEDLARHLILLGASDDVRRFADPGYRSTLIQVRADTVSSADLNALSRRITARLGELPDGLTAYVTGSSYLIARTLDDVTRGQVLSLSAAVVPIFLVLVMMFRSVRIALVALVPNVLPIAAFFGILGWTATPLNLTTSLVASAVLGIAVDDSIHFFARLRAAHRDGVFEHDAVRVAITAVLRPVTLTTLGLALGFAALLSGELRSQVDFGWLAATTLLIAWLLDLTFTPALALRFAGRRQN